MAASLDLEQVADERRGIWRTPACRVVPADGGGIEQIAADSDIVEGRGARFPVAELVEGGVEEAERWLLLCCARLIGQREQSSPQRRRRAAACVNLPTAVDVVRV